MAAITDYTLFLGCMIPLRHPQIELAARKSLAALGLKLNDVEGFTCCPEPWNFKGAGLEFWLTVAFRNLAVGEKSGRDILYSGDTQSFERLANKNARAIMAAGVKKITVSCPEGYQTLSQAYPSVIKGWDVKVVHISELLAERMEAGKLKFKKDLNLKVTYQDPCRLGRYMGVYSEPRKVIEALPGVELVEMEHHGPDAICCGVSSWISCGATAKSIQLSRLSEARATNADLLVTSCPKCLIHFRCALSGKVPGEKDDFEIAIEDLTSLVANALGVGGEN